MHEQKTVRAVPPSQTLDRGGFEPAGPPKDVDGRGASEDTGKQLAAFVGNLPAEKSSTVRATGSDLDTTAVTRESVLRAPNRNA